MSMKTYNCPCCGAPLAFAGASGKLECASCGNSFDLESIEAMEQPEQSSISFAMPDETVDAAGLEGYICQSCGAELMTDETTTATECPYCGSPTVLPNRIESGVRPEYVLPFEVTKEAATEAFHGYFKGKKLMPNIFLNTKNRISEMRKLYVPYWLFDCDAHATMAFNAQKVHTERKGDWEVKTTEHYLVKRKGSMGFNSIPVDGSVKLDDRIGESLEPYDLKKAVPFQPAVLTGAMADRADVDAQSCQRRAVERVETSVENAIRNTVTGYTSVTTRSQSIQTTDGKVTPVLMPVWLITTDKEENGAKKTYTFAINGQNGKLTTDVQPDAKKSFVWGAGVFAGVMLVALLALFLLGMLQSGAIGFAVVAAIVAAVLTVGVLRGELKTAVMQSDATDYIRSGSFQLQVKQDFFLYRSVERKKIESDKK